MTKGVPTLLLRDDALQEPRDLVHSLADLYHLTPRQIVEEYNGVKWTRDAIDRWVMDTGGFRRPFVESNPYDAKRRLGWASFSEKSVIFLPPGGPRKPLVVGKPELSAKGWAVVAAVVAAIAAAAAGTRW
jgi:hypothetical protein